jgi:hypothetical protein
VAGTAVLILVGAETLSVKDHSVEFDHGIAVELEEYDND